jgi:hypothetical protein
VSATITERRCSGLPWLTVTGPREEAFRALGRHAAEEIRAVLDELPERGPLERYAATRGGKAALAAGLSEARRSHPRELAELAALADGARLELDALLLANLRGDLGSGDGTGCSDIGWRRERSYVAHNEDAAPALHGRLTLLTLLIDGDAPVTAQWYPGFLPSNASAITGYGLVCTITHVPATPAAAAGRHFVARGLQQSRSLDDAIAFLRSHPSAGAFGYTLGEFSTGRVASVEVVAGKVSAVQADAAQPLLWHTNHARRVEPGATTYGSAGSHLGELDESRARGCVLDALSPPAGEPDVGWFLNVLSGTPGVYRSAVDDPLMTLCTSVADLGAGAVTFQGRDEAPVTVPLRDLTPA